MRKIKGCQQIVAVFIRVVAGDPIAVRRHGWKSSEQVAQLYRRAAVDYHFPEREATGPIGIENYPLRIG